MADEKIRVLLQPGIYLVATRGSDRDYKEIYIDLENEKGEFIQPLAMVGEQWEISDKLEEEQVENKTRVLVWSDPDNEEYTHEIEIDIKGEDN